VAVSQSRSFSFSSSFSYACESCFVQLPSGAGGLGDLMRGSRGEEGDESELGVLQVRSLDYRCTSVRQVSCRYVYEWAFVL